MKKRKEAKGLKLYAIIVIIVAFFFSLAYILELFWSLGVDIPPFLYETLSPMYPIGFFLVSIFLLIYSIVIAVKIRKIKECLWYAITVSIASIIYLSGIIGNSVFCIGCDPPLFFYYLDNLLLVFPIFSAILIIYSIVMLKKK
jgi:hypothetical protein